MSDERKKILDMVASGRISPEEGSSLLGLVDGQPDTPAAGGAGRTDASVEDDHRSAYDLRANEYWRYALVPGLVLALIGGTVISSRYAQGRTGAATWLCGWLPLATGTLLATLAAWSRNARWVHIRVRENARETAVGFPVPLRLAAALIRVARPFSSRLRDTAIDEAIVALDDGLQTDQPIVVDVDDEAGGEKISIRIG